MEFDAEDDADDDSDGQPPGSEFLRENFELYTEGW